MPMVFSSVASLIRDSPAGLRLLSRNGEGRGPENALRVVHVDEKDRLVRLLEPELSQVGVTRVDRDPDEVAVLDRNRAARTRAFEDEFGLETRVFAFSSAGPRPSRDGLEGSLPCSGAVPARPSEDRRVCRRWEAPVAFSDGRPHGRRQARAALSALSRSGL